MGNLTNRGASMSTGGKGIHDRAEGIFMPLNLRQLKLS